MFSGVVRQQTLDVVLHQRVEATDERGDHPAISNATPHHSGG